MATQQQVNNSFEADDVSVFTYAEESVVGEDGVNKKKKFRKFRKSLSKKRKSIRNLLGGSQRKLDLCNDVVVEAKGFNNNRLHDEQTTKTKKIIDTTTDSASSGTSLDHNNVEATANHEEHADMDLNVSAEAKDFDVKQLSTVREDSKSSVTSVVKTSQILLLIIDPASRRFEVLQLDLDMGK